MSESESRIFHHGGDGEEDFSIRNESNFFFFYVHERGIENNYGGDGVVMVTESSFCSVGFFCFLMEIGYEICIYYEERKREVKKRMDCMYASLIHTLGETAAYNP